MATLPHTYSLSTARPLLFVLLFLSSRHAVFQCSGELPLCANVESDIMLPSHLRLLVAALLVGVTCAFEGVVRAAAPDPSIVYANGYYHMTYTSADHIEMVRARTLKGLLIGKVRQVYFEPNITRNAYIVRTRPAHSHPPRGPKAPRD